MRAKLLGEKRGSKRWWKIANEIMDVSGSSTVIPALKTESGWAFSPEEKADLFADTFAAKFSVPGANQMNISSNGRILIFQCSEIAQMAKQAPSNRKVPGLNTL